MLKLNTSGCCCALEGTRCWHPKRLFPCWFLIFDLNQKIAFFLRGRHQLWIESDESNEPTRPRRIDWP